MLTSVIGPKSQLTRIWTNTLSINKLTELKGKNQ